MRIRSCRPILFLKIHKKVERSPTFQKYVLTVPWFSSYFRRSLNFCFFIQPVEKGFDRLSGLRMWEKIPSDFLPLFEDFYLSLNLLMWSKHFYQIAFIKKRKVAVNLVCKNGLFGQVWHTFVFEYGQIVFWFRYQSYHSRERYRSFLTLSYHAVLYHSSTCS